MIEAILRVIGTTEQAHKKIIFILHIGRGTVNQNEKYLFQGKYIFWESVIFYST